MTDERRYQDDEIKQIFEAAATARGSDGRALSSADGLTLAELQAIGQEVGVAPERIADAASALEQRRASLPRQTYMGMPISVGRTVDLPRPPTDHEWDLLVAELRETFRAQGKESSRGNLRQWKNGNLHAYVEPTETGYRLRLGTLKGNAMVLHWVGIGGMVMGLVLLGVLLVTGELNDLSDPLVLAAMGAAAFAVNAINLPRWAREREAQMEYIAARAGALIRDEAGDS